MTCSLEPNDPRMMSSLTPVYFLTLLVFTRGGITQLEFTIRRKVFTEKEMPSQSLVSRMSSQYETVSRISLSASSAKDLRKIANALLKSNLRNMAYAT